MLRELFILAKMLFKRTSELSEIRMIEMKHFPFSGYSYMMWCGCIVTRHADKKISVKSYNHERIHLMQALRYKRWYRYYIKYFWEWLKGNPIIHPSSSAYYTIPFEAEAYANAEKHGYMPTRETLKRYELKRRKKTYREHKKEWESFIKTL